MWPGTAGPGARCKLVTLTYRIPCESCKRLFTHSRSRRAKTCSKACKQALYRARVAERAKDMEVYQTWLRCVEQAEYYAKARDFWRERLAGVMESPLPQTAVTRQQLLEAMSSDGIKKHTAISFLLSYKGHNRAVKLIEAGGDAPEVGKLLAADIRGAS